MKLMNLHHHYLEVSNES